MDIRHFRAGAAKGTSKGIISNGWTNNRFKNLTIGYTTICFSLEDNPHHPSIDADLYRFESVSFCPNDHTYGIGLKVDNAQAWDLSMDGSNEISYCKYGIYWVSKNKQRTRQVSFSNMQFESRSMDYCVYMDMKGNTITGVHSCCMAIIADWLSGSLKNSEAVVHPAFNRRDQPLVEPQR